MGATLIVELLSFAGEEERVERTLMNEEKAKMHEQDIARAELERLIDGLTLFDDELFSKVFDENIEATTLLLQIILERQDLVVLSVKGQEELQNPIYGGRTITLDVRAKFADGTHVNIEVQRNTEGSHIRRARYHSSNLDVRMLKKGQAFETLKDSYVIFICENDKFRKGLPMYHINRCISETGEWVNDGSHIIYVNGKYRGNDRFGCLMTDFSCKKVSDMHFEELADSVKHVKESRKGCVDMSEAIQQWAEKWAGKWARQMATKMANEMANEMATKMANEMASERVEKEKLKNKRSIAQKMLKSGKMTINEIVAYLDLPVDEVEKLAGDDNIKMNEHEAKSMRITIYDDAQIMKNHDADLTRTVTERVTKRVTKSVTKRVTERVTKESNLKSIKNLMQRLLLTEEDAMDALDIPKEERSRYKELLKTQ